MNTPIPSYLYRGQRQNTDTLEAQTIPPGDKHRFPEGTDKVVFATWSETEAKIYGLLSRTGKAFQIAPYIKEGVDLEDNESWESLENKVIWRVTCSEITREELLKSEQVYIYRFPSEGFEWDNEGHELWSKTTVENPEVKALTPKEILDEWEREGNVELKLSENNEGKRIFK